MLEARAAEQRELIDYYAGKTDRHPQGELAKRFILPRALTSNCWDAAEGAWRFSEWGLDWS